MLTLSLVTFALACLPLLITTLNFATMRVVRDRSYPPIQVPVSVLIPMRNEERNARACLEAASASVGLADLSISVLDDNSTDRTGEIAQSIPGIRVLSGKPLEAGWLGKNFAAHQLSESSTGEYLVFIDADVRLHPQAINSAITLMDSLGWSYISPYPRQIAKSLIEKLMQPLLQWSFMSSLPLRLAERFHHESMVVANGQFLIIKRDAYVAAGGHAAIRASVLDDLELARTLTRHGFYGGVADGSEVANCRMYTNRAELFEGYRKSLWTAFGGALGASGVAVFLAITGVLPLILCATSQPFFLAAYLAIVVSRILAGIKSRSSIRYSPVHALSIVLFIYLLATSFWQHANGQLTWRGRKITTHG